MQSNENGVVIRKYSAADEDALFQLLEREGEAWEDYWRVENREKYRHAMKSSTVYVALEDEVLCGYARCRDDGGYGLYVYDLLVDRAHRGKGYGRMLMERAAADYPENETYVMSDVDEYYDKLGYDVEGTIFTVKP